MKHSPVEHFELGDTSEAALRMAKLRAKEAGTLTQELVRCLFDYDPDTGALTHRCGPNAGGSAVVIRRNRKSEEVDIVVPGRDCQLIGARRIIWLWVHGVLPGRVDKYRRHYGNQLSNLRPSFRKMWPSKDECFQPVPAPAPLPRVTIERIGNMIIHRGVVPYDLGDPEPGRSALDQRMLEERKNDE